MAKKVILNLPNNPYEDNTFLSEEQNIFNILKNICKKFPLLEKEIFNQNNEIYPYLKCFLNEKSVESTKLHTTNVKDDDELFIFCAIRGG